MKEILLREIQENEESEWFKECNKEFEEKREETELNKDNGDDEELNKDELNKDDKGLNKEEFEEWNL